MVKVTERGWGGHFIWSRDCLFRRNTLLENGESRVVVSTVGAFFSENKLREIRFDRYYETMAFAAKKDGKYWEADVVKELDFISPWAINAKSADDLPDGVDNDADAMHDAVVAEFVAKLERK